MNNVLTKKWKVPCEVGLNKGVNKIKNGWEKANNILKETFFKKEVLHQI
jgi:hypothetical protein